MKVSPLCPLLILVVIVFLFVSCSGPSGLFGKRSPHEQYQQKLNNAGLQQTALGKLWSTEARRSLEQPLTITVPYKEAGYFAADRPRAMALKFGAKKGQQLSISLEKKPVSGFTIYVDLWEIRANKNKKLVASADTNGRPFSYDIDDEGMYLLRLQPELLASGEYTLVIRSDPQLAFPVENGRIGSFWGDDRDGGARRHEGVDIFAKRGTPALAAADGIVNRVNETNIGGKVVFLRPSNKDINLYYAHLDEQLVSAGQRVKRGDTIGLVGNTGNAVTTSPHLHFGIYTFGGAIDPVNFIKPSDKKPAAITAPLSSLRKSLRTVSAANLRESPDGNSGAVADLPPNTLVHIEAASSRWYKVILPSGTEGFITGASLKSLDVPLKEIVTARELPLLDKPQMEAARKASIAAGTRLRVLGLFNDFYLVNSQETSGWIKRNL